MPTFNTVESLMMRLSLKALLLGILIISIIPSNRHRPKQLRAAVMSIDELVQDSLFISMRDGQCYYVTPSESLGNAILTKRFVPVHVRGWRSGEKRYYFSDQPDTNAKYESIVQRYWPYLFSVVKIVEQTQILFLEVNENYIYGTTFYDRKGQTRFFYPRYDINTETIDSLLRDLVSYPQHRPLDAIPIKGDDRFRYMIVPEEPRPAPEIRLKRSREIDGIHLLPLDNAAEFLEQTNWPDAIPYSLVDTKPAFESDINGKNSLGGFNLWVLSKMNVAEKDKKSGTVKVGVLLSEEGEVLDVENLEKGELTPLAEAYIQAARESPKWTPASHQGNPCKVIIPIITEIEYGPPR